VQAGTPFAVLMLDIDHFKAYNDHYGHQAGDDCLKRVAQVIDATIQHSNARGLTVQAFAARYGGEEFAVLVQSATQGRCQQLAQAIVSAVSALGIAHEKMGTGASPRCQSVATGCPPPKVHCSRCFARRTTSSTRPSSKGVTGLDSRPICPAWVPP